MPPVPPSGLFPASQFFDEPVEIASFWVRFVDSLLVALRYGKGRQVWGDCSGGLNRGLVHQPHDLVHREGPRKRGPRRKLVFLANLAFPAPLKSGDDSNQAIVIVARANTTLSLRKGWLRLG